MVCKIAFSGYKNVSGYKGSLLPKGEMGSLSLQLNNTGEFNDLKDFQPILKNFKDKSNLGFLSIDTAVFEDGSVKFYLNDKDLLLNDKNLGIFTRISKLMQRVVKNPVARMDTDYKEGGDLVSNMYKGYGKLSPAQEKLFVETIIDKGSISKTAEFIQNTIQKSMEKYFRV